MLREAADELERLRRVPVGFVYHGPDGDITLDPGDVSIVFEQDSEEL